MPQADLKCRIEGETIVLQADSFVRQVAIEAVRPLEVTVDENWFDLPAGVAKTVCLRGRGAGEVRIAALNAPSTTLRVQI